MVLKFSDEPKVQMFYTKKMSLAFVNGKYVPEGFATISANDLGLLRGYGVFDFLRTYNGKPFYLDAHIDRLRFSSEQIGLDFPFENGFIAEIVEKLITANQLQEANIKILVTGGKSEDHLTPSGDPTLIVLAYPLIVYPEHFYEKGVSVLTNEHLRHIPSSKSINYIPAIIALKEARKKNAFESLFVHKGKILEATTCNFFAVKNGKLITCNKKILHGITRAITLELCNDLLPIEMRFINYEELSSIEEAFLTSSNKEILPVVSIDGKMVGTGSVGEITKKIMELFHNFTRSGKWEEYPYTYQINENLDEFISESL